jgi:2-methylcitrate dehydratase
MDKTEERLTAFAHSLSFRDIEPPVLHALKRRFIDTIGCALGAFHVEMSQIARNIASKVESSAKAGMIGTDAKSSPDLAAFANTAMIRCLDLNDDYFGKDGPHPSDTIGAVLAVGDSGHADGKTVLNAIALAYEVLCSFADAVGLRERGWDYVTFTAVAAALGAGKALKLPEEKLRHCLSLAAVCNSALGQTRLGELSMWKGLASANACRNGVFAAMLAADGVTGPELCFEGKNGLIAQVTGPLDLSALGKQPLRAGVVYLKRWPVFYSAQASVQAALELRKSVAPSDIKSITVESYKKWSPKSRETADHSVPFCVAAALLDGDITAATFDSQRFLDPEVIELMAKVQLREDPQFTKEYPQKWNCRIIAETFSGERHQVHVNYPKGHPQNPFTDEEVEEKFMKLAQPLIGSERCQSFLDWAWRLEEARDVTKMFQILAH